MEVRPGASSLIGLLLEIGPLLVVDGGGLVQNNVSWANLVDYVWVDQPVYVFIQVTLCDAHDLPSRSTVALDFQPLNQMVAIVGVNALFNMTHLLIIMVSVLNEDQMGQDFVRNPQI